jgi:hypothetical protein
MRPTGLGPSPEDRWKVGDIVRHEHATVGCGELENLVVGEALELWFLVERAHIVASCRERCAHSSPRDVGVEEHAHQS